MYLDAERSPALRATIQTLALLPKEMSKQIRKHTKSVVQPEWKRALAEQAPAERIFHTRLVGPSSAYVSDRNVRLNAGAAGKFPRETEFGAYREEYNEYMRQGRKVRRRTQRQFWHYTKKGHVVYPAARDIIPRIGSLWVQTVVRTIHEMIEKANR